MEGLIRPLLATLVSKPFHRTSWVHEEKYDGDRALGYRRGWSGAPLRALLQRRAVGEAIPPDVRHLRLPRAFALHVGRMLEEQAPDLVTTEMSIAKRQGRVFADALRNGFGQTIVAPYSVRRRPKAPVSTPLSWDEVDPGLDPARYTIRTIESRLAKTDPWSDFWANRQRLPDLR